MRKALTPVLMLLFLLPLPLLADTTYTYTGNDFTYFTVGAPFTTSMSVSGSFTVASPIPASYGTWANVLAFSFTDGIDSFSSSDPNDTLTAMISTSASGAFNVWAIVATSTSGADLYTCFAVAGGCDTTDLGRSIGGTSAFNLADQGTWASTTLTPVPEPSAIFLFGSGLAGLAGIVRCRLLG
jgi:hypothetical protein